MGKVGGKTLAVWGLSFKPNTDDMREAPSIEIIKSLLKHKVKIRAFDPVATPNARKNLPEIIYCDSPHEAVRDADALIVLTEWNEFKQIDLADIKKHMKGNYLFDGRNIYDPTKIKELGFIYKGVGRQ